MMFVSVRGSRRTARALFAIDRGSRRPPGSRWWPFRGLGDPRKAVRGRYRGLGDPRKNARHHRRGLGDPRSDDRQHVRGSWRPGAGRKRAPGGLREPQTETDITGKATAAIPRGPRVLLPPSQWRHAAFSSCPRPSRQGIPARDTLLSPKRRDVLVCSFKPLRSAATCSKKSIAAATRILPEAQRERWAPWALRNENRLQV